MRPTRSSSSNNFGMGSKSLRRSISCLVHEEASDSGDARMLRGAQRVESGPRSVRRRRANVRDSISVGRGGRVYGPPGSGAAMLPTNASLTIEGEERSDRNKRDLIPPGDSF